MPLESNQTQKLEDIDLQPHKRYHIYGLLPKDPKLVGGALWSPNSSGFNYLQRPMPDASVDTFLRGRCMKESVITTGGIV